MPTYGYECLGCGRSFETYQRITDDPLTNCDECGAVLKKKVFPVGIVFKGSGFYVNDYAKKSAGGDDTSSVKAEAPAAAAETAAATATTAEIKPAETKAETATPVPAAATTPAPSPKPTA